MSKNNDLINDDFDDEKIEVDWSIDSDEDSKDKDIEIEELEELEEIDNLSEILEDNEKESKKVSPDINIEIVNEDNKKGVKISINLEIDKNIVSIDFVINKKTIFLFL